MLRFSMVHAGNVKLAIFDITGHEVARLWNGFMPAGVHALPWDGTDRHGRRAPSGIYFGKLMIDTQASHTQRIALVR